MLKSERVTCESDGIEIEYINSNWLIRQRASRQQNVHLEREEMIREAESRKSLVENGDVIEELCCTHFCLLTQKAFQGQPNRMLLCEVEASHLSDLSSTPRQLVKKGEILFFF